MKKLKFTLIFLGFVTATFGQTADLNGVTFGFGAGYNGSIDQTYDYSLTTDATHSLQAQRLSQWAFVISSVVMVKLGKTAIDQNNGTFIKQSKETEYNALLNSIKESQSLLKHQKDSLKSHHINIASNKTIEGTQSELTEKQKNVNTSWAGFWNHASVDLAVDLVNIAPNPSFNKSISGGLGFGYFITQDVQLALFYDISSIPQLRNYIVNKYEGKSIPNGIDANGAAINYTSLSTTDANLFYNKTISGFTFKLIFSLANKKAVTTSTTD
jgi:hypothetical protein